MENKSEIENLVSQAGDYLNTRLELLKLKTVDKAAEVISSVVSKLALIFFFVLFTLIVSMGAAFWIGDMLGKTFYGFFIIAGFYLIAGLVLYVCRRKWLKAPIANVLIRKILN